MQGEDPIYRLLDSARRFLVSANSAIENSVGKRFSDDLEAEAGRHARPMSIESANVRGLRYADDLLSRPDGDISDLFAAVRCAFTLARWSEFYEETPWSQGFISRFATGECIGPTGPFRSDDVILGLFVLGPETNYPAHAHAAEEFYIVVSGEAEFQTGVNAKFILKKQGDVVFHESHVSHAIRTSSQPLLAVYGWRGDLLGPSWFRCDMADETEPKQFPARV